MASRRRFRPSLTAYRPNPDNPPPVISDEAYERFWGRKRGLSPEDQELLRQERRRRTAIAPEGSSVQLVPHLGLPAKEAILLRYLASRLRQSPANVEGRSWIFASAQLLHVCHPYISRAAIHKGLQSLYDRGEFSTRSFTTRRYELSGWYSMTQEQIDRVLSSRTSSFIVQDAMNHGLTKAILLGNRKSRALDDSLSSERFKKANYPLSRWQIRNGLRGFDFSSDLSLNLSIEDLSHNSTPKFFEMHFLSNLK